MQQADEIARELERQLQASTGKIEAFVSQQAAALAKAQQDHELLMRDMEGACVRQRRRRRARARVRFHTRARVLSAASGARLPRPTPDPPA